jgi:hypothetical protein
MNFIRVVGQEAKFNGRLQRAENVALDSRQSMLGNQLLDSV